MNSIPYGNIFTTLWSKEFIEQAYEAQTLYRVENPKICIQAKEFKFYFSFLRDRVDADNHSGGVFNCKICDSRGLVFEYSEEIAPKPLEDAFIEFILILRRVVEARGSDAELDACIETMRKVAEEKDRQKQAKLNGVITTSGGLIWVRDENGKYQVI